MKYTHEKPIFELVLIKLLEQVSSFIELTVPIVRFEQITPKGILLIFDHQTEKLLKLNAKWKFSKVIQHEQGKIILIVITFFDLEF